LIDCQTATESVHPGCCTVNVVLTATFDRFVYELDISTTTLHTDSAT